MFIEINPALLPAFLFFLVSGFYLYLCVVTFVTNTKSKSRDDYLSTGCCIVLYSLGYGLMTITTDETLCRIFWAVGFVSSCLFFSRWLVFSSNMVTIKHTVTKFLINASTVLTTVISIACIFSNDASFVLTKYGFHFSYQNSLLFKVVNIYMIIIIFAFLIIFLRWLYESELKRNRIQALLFLILSTFIAPIGFSADFVIPTFTANTAIPLAAICFLPISMPMFISMRKYKTLSITVPNASGYVFNTVTIPTLVLDHKNIIKLENAAAFNFFGFSAVGKNISEILLEDGITPDQAFFDNVFENKKVSVETPVGIRICDMVLAIENDKYDDILCKVVLLKDITINEHKDNMLQAALEQANTASRAKSVFLSNMSHEIRTPMNAIIGMTAIGKTVNTIEKKDDALDKIGEASKHLLGVINDILDMSKIEANKLELSNVHFDFEKMLRNVSDVVTFRVNERHQKFYVNIGKDIPHTLIGDDQRLSQVITNLLGNAVKFTPDGGTIRLDSQIISKEEDVCSLQISVEDTGIGITDEQKSRLFKSFEQAETDTTRKFGGTGLGLAISKRIVELMGGDIWVESEEGKGSKFIFTVLLNREQSLDEDEGWENIRIFAAAGEPEILDFFMTFSETRGIGCTVASSGEETLKELEKDDKYDICFLDWNLPDTNCIELAGKIRARSAIESFVIICSSIDHHEAENKAQAASIDRFLLKPLFPSVVSDMVNECTGVGRCSVKQENMLNLTDDFSAYSILLAEDIKINREIVMALLEPTNLNIDCAENGAQAFNLFTKSPEKYNLIFMDVQMPEMDGYETTRKIRALDVPRAKTIPIIAMTANVFREDVDKCLDAGMNGHVGKPLDFDEVVARLRMYLG